jgi:hypothetical protein
VRRILLHPPSSSFWEAAAVISRRRLDLIAFCDALGLLLAEIFHNGFKYFIF